MGLKLLNCSAFLLCSVAHAQCHTFRGKASIFVPPDGRFHHGARGTQAPASCCLLIRTVWQTDASSDENVRRTENRYDCRVVGIISQTYYITLSSGLHSGKQVPRIQPWSTCMGPGLVPHTPRRPGPYVSPSLICRYCSMRYMQVFSTSSTSLLHLSRRRTTRPP